MGQAPYPAVVTPRQLGKWHTERSHQNPRPKDDFNPTRAAGLLPDIGTLTVSPIATQRSAPPISYGSVG